jgi:hypothetical protein
MNRVTKILNKILGNLIQQLIKKTTCHDQVGFTPGMLGEFHICKPINATHKKNQGQKSDII